jgi:activator of 2-hydroxyglutaryl-CoA dehydratase
MPYVKEWKRTAVNHQHPMDTGELCYVFYETALVYIAQRGKNFESISAAIGMLERAAHEVERRVLDPYEDKKIKENGDIQVEGVIQ